MVSCCRMQNQKVFHLHQKETEALKKACLYSLPPNKLGYCGPEKSWQTFTNFFSNPSEENALEARTCLKGFNALMPYLELIAKENSLKVFDEKVIEAYWIGNKLLENVSFKETQEAILSLQNYGLPRSIAKKKAAELPEGMLPHHSMHVLYINFISQKVKPLVENLSSCMIQWAEVKDSENLVVKGIELFSESNELKSREKEKKVSNPLKIPLEEGDLVTVHWDNLVETIDDNSLKNLKNYTFINLEKVNNFLGRKE